MIGVPHADFGEGVTAVVVCDKGADVDEASVLKALDGRLAKFKMPKRVIVVDELPRNAMGKVQKNLRDTYQYLREVCGYCGYRRQSSLRAELVMPGLVRGHPRLAALRSRKTWIAGSGSNAVFRTARPGYDEKANRFQAIRTNLKMLNAFSVRLSG